MVLQLEVLVPQPSGSPLATPDFLPMLVARYESDGLDDIVGPALAGARRCTVARSPSLVGR